MENDSSRRSKVKDNESAMKNVFVFHSLRYFCRWRHRVLTRRNNNLKRAGVRDRKRRLQKAGFALGRNRETTS